MPRNFNLAALLKFFPQGRESGPTSSKDPRLIVRVVLGVLLLANVVAAAFVLHPWGGSAEDLERQAISLQTQIQQRRTAVEKMRLLVAKVEKGRAEGDQFLGDYFLPRRAAAQTLLFELSEAAKKAGIVIKEHSNSEEPIEGSENFSMFTITGSYEGTYKNVIDLINLLDKSKRLLIVEGLQAAPVANSAGKLNITLRINAFAREEGPLQ